MKLVFVHGRSQENKKLVDLTKTWTDALFQGFANAGAIVPTAIVDVVMPYYGDVLYQLTQQAGRASSGNVVNRGLEAYAPSAEELKFYRRFIQDVIDTKGITDAELEAETGGDVKDRDIQNWKAVLATLRFLNRSKRVAAASIERFTEDVWLYLKNAGVRDEIDKLVGPLIPMEDRCIVIAHSLGSIVAYNLLRHRDNCNNVAAFVTLGSPLGIEVIIEELPTNGAPRLAPEGAGIWFNARDAQDTVALHEILSDRFDGSPLVENYSRVKNTSSNKHGIEEYLHDKVVAAKIYSVLRGS
jgi:hypothetical protein